MRRGEVDVHFGIGSVELILENEGVAELEKLDL